VRRALLAAAAAAVVSGAPAAPAARAAPAAPYGYLSAPTDQLAVPGVVPGALVTPEGWVYTGRGELRFALDGRAVRVRDRTWRDPREPVLRGAVERDGLRVELEWLAARAPAAHVSVRAVVVNGGRRARTIRWRAALRHGGGAFRFLRPAVPAFPGLYDQPGVGPEAPWAVGSDAGGAGRSDAGDAGSAPRGDAGDGGGAGSSGAASRDGAPLAVLPAPAALGDGADAVAATAVRRLRPGGRAVLDHVVWLEPASAPAPRHAAARGQHAADWRDALAGSLRIDVPEAKVGDAFDAALVQLLQSRYRRPDGQWVQTVNKLQYHAFWLRDAAIQTHALDLAGLHRAAREDLGFFATWQRDDGQWLSRMGQLDGHGQALWALGEHARRTRDAAFAREWLPRVERAMTWLRDARARDPLGLVPPSDPRDNELVAGHLAGDQAWAVAGAEAATDLAALAGDTARAARFRAEAADLRAVVAERFREAAARGSASAAHGPASGASDTGARGTGVRGAGARGTGASDTGARDAGASGSGARGSGGGVPPALDAPGGRDWGNLWISWPTRALAPNDPLVTATLRAHRARWREGIATYGPRSLHGYLGFRALETHLQRGEQAEVVRGLYAHLAHTTATHGGFEIGIRPYGRRASRDNLAPHGWFAAELVALVRNLLVRETGDGGLELGGAIPPAWLRPGTRATRVANASTPHGRVDFTLTPRRGGARLRWSGPAGVPLRWRLPDGRRLTLPGARGTTTARFTLPRRPPTFASTVAALQRAYCVRRLSPPADSRRRRCRSSSTSTR
jgi:hypothetical protein